jgi:hypothetical protein
MSTQQLSRATDPPVSMPLAVAAPARPEYLIDIDSIAARRTSQAVLRRL